MARSDAVWGIDIGNCSLKALRCRPHESPDRINADAFDFIEYPKILTQPGAEPAELIADALKTFLSRNSVRGDRVAISVPGQNGLARFIKLPPVEAKKIPDIVRYEARQQIPFDLNDVIWDYQRMGGGSEEEGFALETEIGLFAMKRDQVFRALEPFRAAGIEVDFVQLTPLCLYNYAFFDLLYDLPPIDEYDPDDPPPSIVLLSMGTDATDLVVTNGYRVWQRSVPLGGNHFTKALTKELKLTFAKAEHLKRNATAAEDPKAVFQAMRPVFNDLLTEIQRSLGYFTSIDRNAKIRQVVTLGNSMKLPGLRRYLAQSLGYEVTRAEAFRGLCGAEVVNTPAFKENLLSYSVCYGLALQGLARGALRTNLLPRELVKDRLIREKKPWAVAAAAVLMTSLTISFVGYSLSMANVNEERWKDSEGAADRASGTAQRLQGELKDKETQFDEFDRIGKNVVSNVEGRIRWLELMRVVNECLPRDLPALRDKKEIEDRDEVHIASVDIQHVTDVGQWVALMKKCGWYQLTSPAPGTKAAPGQTATAPGVPGAAPNPAGAAMAGAPGAAAPVPAAPGTAAAGTAAASPVAAGGVAGAPGAGDGPSGPGWIVQLYGYHDHNKEQAGLVQGAEYVRRTLINNLENKQILLPTGEKDENGAEIRTLVKASDLGISFPSVVNPGQVVPTEIDDPTAARTGQEMGPGGRAMGGPAGPGHDDQKPKIKVRRFEFVVQFCWQPKLPSERRKMKEALEKSPSGTPTGAAAATP